ncbi:hypothetical protein REIS_2002 [Rickettsia endosymbiont of Ixodes scapularis]|nr:hypothetical protein REIS_2002 [Rickettsia endosymbiont of Ixodes scapularis]
MLVIIPQSILNEKNLISLNTIFIDKQKCSASIKIAIFNDELDYDK